VKEVSVEVKKDMVTVKGTMDVKSLPNILQGKLKRSVEFIPAKKEDTGDKASAEKKEKASEKAEKGSEKTEKVDESGDEKEKKEQGKGDGDAGGKKGKNKKKGKSANNDEKKEDKEEGKNAEEKPSAESADPVKSLLPPPADMINRFDFFQPYGYRGAEIIHTPQIFSDENPNACMVM
jgi:hypothetical protein